MKQLLLVFIGGGFGSVLRYLIGKSLNNSQSFPLGTFTANILGSLIIGFILGFALRNNNLTQNHTLLIATGFCGGFTTFSSFAYENHLLLKSGDFINFIIYISLTFIVGLITVFGGIYLSKFI